MKLTVTNITVPRVSLLFERLEQEDFPVTSVALMAEADDQSRYSRPFFVSATNALTVHQDEKIGEIQERALHQSIELFRAAADAIEDKLRR